MPFQGSYYSNECGLEITATEADAGEWRCNMEEYWSGYSRGDGATVEETITVNVIPLPEPETPAPTIPTTESTIPTSASAGDLPGLGSFELDPVFYAPDGQVLTMEEYNFLQEYGVGDDDSNFG